MSGALNEASNGVLYGVGVGPGDPELITLKALRTVGRCQVLAIPVSDITFAEPVYAEAECEALQGYQDNCVAYQIMLPELSNIKNMAKLYLPMPMIKDKNRLKAAHEKAADAIESQLKQGKAVAFLTLGDPTVYSTYLYVHKRIVKRGYETEIIPGITSFCAAAAAMNIGLVENKEALHVIPASYEVEQGLSLPGTKVLMKAGKKMAYVKTAVKARNMELQMIENCGMKTEQIYHRIEDVPDDAGYYSLIIIKGENK